MIIPGGAGFRSPRNSLAPRLALTTCHTARRLWGPCGIGVCQLARAEPYPQACDGRCAGCCLGITCCGSCGIGVCLPRHAPSPAHRPRRRCVCLVALVAPKAFAVAVYVLSPLQGEPVITITVHWKCIPLATPFVTLYSQVQIQSSGLSATT